MSYHEIDLEHYSRREQFDYFRTMAQPYAGVTASIDITEIRAKQQKEGWPFFLTMLYVAGTAANRVPELRHRIRGERIVSYDVCDTSHTVALPDGNYCYCRVPGGLPFREFLPLAAAAHQAAKERGTLREEGADIDSLLFVSSLPWLSYTALIQPTPFPADSNPRITFGGYYWQGERLLLPVTLLVNHALADGAHISKFYRQWEQAVQELLSEA